MKLTKLIGGLYISVVLSLSAIAQTPEPDPTIKGDLNIKFATRENPGAEGVSDVYTFGTSTVGFNVANSAAFRGTISHSPTIKGMIGISQQGGLTYAIDTDVVNPKNPTQTKPIGKIYGGAPVDLNNAYLFTPGNVKISTNTFGSIKGFDSKLSGIALGKPPAKTGFINKIQQDTLSIVKQVQGKPMAISVSKYDKMEFQNVTLFAGPVPIYGETVINGTIIYDYKRSAWHFQNVTASYVDQSGRKIQDSISGSIRWSESPNRKANGEGTYEFDVRINEPLATEAAAFASAAQEDAFFTVDNTIQALTGTMKYKDTLSGDTVIASSIKVDLVGTKLNKHQVMYLFKTIFFVALVPFNSE